MDFEVRGSFWVGNYDFSNWFYFVFRPAHASLFPHDLDYERFEEVMKNLQRMTGKPVVSLREFVALFCFIYNETGGTFRSMKEGGGAAWYSAHGYHTKSAGRGLIQLTSDSVYRVALKPLGIDYDSLSAEELDALFLKPDVYYPAVYQYLNNPYLAGNHWAKIQEGKFYEFGTAISGDRTGVYGTTFQQRCEALLTALQKETLKNSQTLLPNKKIIKYTAYGVGTALVCVSLYWWLTQD